MFELIDIGLHYGSNPVLSDINLSLRPGQLTVILGPNGAGKSSLLRLAAGELSSPQQGVTGEVQFCGKVISNWPLEDMSRRLAVLPQQSSLSFPFLVEEVVMLGRTPHDSGFERDRQTVQQSLAAVDARHLARRTYTQLSGGEKQRVQLARVLAQVWDAQGEPGGALLLDEPVSALDLAHQKQLMELLKSRAERGDCIAVALHDLNLAAAYADQVVLLSGGALHSLGSPEQVLQPEPLKEIFQLDFHRVSHPASGRPLLFY